MQGLHVFDPRAAVAVDLESLVQQDHLLRKVDRILKTPFIRELTASCYASGLGRPSIDPEGEGLHSNSSTKCTKAPRPRAVSSWTPM